MHSINFFLVSIIKTQEINNLHSKRIIAGDETESHQAAGRISVWITRKK